MYKIILCAAETEELHSVLQGFPRRQNWDTEGHPVGLGLAHRGLFITSAPLHPGAFLLNDAWHTPLIHEHLSLDLKYYFLCYVIAQHLFL